MTSKIIYPKPLPVLIKQNLPLETGFTPTEIVALQNGWRLIKRRLNYHSGKIFIEFFSENYLLLEKFRDVMTEKFDLNHLHQHPYQLMNIYEKLIESGLNDAAHINALLSEVGSRHKSFGVTYEDIKLKTDFINRYFNQLLEKIKSITFETGLAKLSELINEHHREKDEAEVSTIEDKNDIFN
ncbi:globin 3 [Cochliomyia hominivorax]